MQWEEGCVSESGWVTVWLVYCVVCVFCEPVFLRGALRTSIDVGLCLGFR